MSSSRVPNMVGGKQQLATALTGDPQQQQKQQPLQGQQLNLLEGPQTSRSYSERSVEIRSLLQEITELKKEIDQEFLELDLHENDPHQLLRKFSNDFATCTSKHTNIPVPAASMNRACLQSTASGVHNNVNGIKNSNNGVNSNNTNGFHNNTNGVHNCNNGVVSSSNGVHSNDFHNPANGVNNNSAANKTNSYNGNRLATSWTESSKDLPKQPNQRKSPWDIRFEELCHFVKRFDHAQVPIGWEENVRLSTWVSKQRQQYRLLQRGKPSQITKERISLLEEIGFVWKASRGRPSRTNNSGF